MSALVEFSIFPIDKGESLGSYAARAIKIIKESGLPYEVNPMGTCVEGEWEEIMALVTRCHKALEEDCHRIHLTLRSDFRKGRTSGLTEKLKTVEKHLQDS